jgi:hypothetical protein
MASVSIKLDRRFYKVARGVFEKYNFDVGVLEDKAHYLPAKGKQLKRVAGGPARRQSRTPSGMTVADVSESLRKNLGINFYRAPFRSKANRDILKFTKAFFRLCAGRSEKRRCENLLQAIVRNPIVRGDYGNNSPVTRKIKGFDRLMIDTGQLFKAIKAVVTRRVSR